MVLAQISKGSKFWSGNNKEIIRNNKKIINNIIRKGIKKK